LLIEWVAPRSTEIHCGSLNVLDHRVVVLPSVAALAGVPAFSVDDAVVVLPATTGWRRACPTGCR